MIMSFQAPSAQDIKRHETAQSMLQIVLRQFVEHKMAVAGAFIILLFFLISIGADLISSVTGIDPNKQNLGARYEQPFTRVEYSADQKESEVERWIANHPTEADAIQKALVAKQVVTVPETDAIYDVTALPKVDALNKLKELKMPETKSLDDLVESFSSYHVMGTDEVGRDVMMRLIYGARVSIGVGLLVAISSALLGLIIGALAGYYGGAMDAVLMRVTDALLSLPIMPVLIVVAAIDLQKLPGVAAILPVGMESIFKMVIILCLFSWMPVARLVRGEILSLREREFVLAAKTLGAKDSTIIGRHMFPNVIAPLLVSITLGVGESILFEAALSFLGLGIMPPTPSWGNMLNNAQEVIYKNIWLCIFPGLMILLTVISFNFVGDGLQDAVDPKSIRR
jgi:peptide/nickel transport system permease protein